MSTIINRHLVVHLKQRLVNNIHNLGIGGFEFRPSSDGSIAVGVTKLA
jgi:hypothetical protein